MHFNNSNQLAITGMLKNKTCQILSIQTTFHHGDLLISIGKRYAKMMKSLLSTISAENNILKTSWGIAFAEAVNCFNKAAGGQT